MVSRERLRELLSRAAETPVVVAGDLIADRYVAGSSGRVSREAPVLILQFQEETTVPGGAANAAMNLRALGARVKLVGLVGDDQRGAELVQLLRAGGVDVEHVVVAADRGTTVKTRVLAGDRHVSRQQVLRIDRDQPDRLSPETETILGTHVREALDGARALLLSDYSQGVLAGASRARALETSRARGLVCCADSRRRLEAFRGVTVATPNESEAIPAVPVEARGSLEAVARRLLAELEAETLFITRGSAGMEVFHRAERPVHVRVVGGVEVVDVTGAGDTVAAAVTLMLAAGGTPVEAAVLASHAAGVVVQKRGTATAPVREILESIETRWESD